MPTNGKIHDSIVDLYKRGYSMMQIAQQFNLSVSTVRYWLEKSNIKRRSVSEAITNLHVIKFHKKPFKLKESLSAIDKELKVSGIMLYWGEGAKNGNTVKFTNSDPEMIKIFLNFLRDICGISESRLKALVHMYPDQDKNKLEQFWSNATKIPLSRFYKSYIHKGKIGTYKNKSKYGTLAINYSDKKLLKIILFWIEEYKVKLI